jgi:hypothetical protein
MIFSLSITYWVLDRRKALIFVTVPKWVPKVLAKAHLMKVANDA